MEQLITWFSKNHVAANFVMVIILIVGISTWSKLSKEIFPETAVDIVIVSVIYPNAAPEEVEKGVVLPIEEAVEDLDGIDRITSSSAQSSGSVLIEVKNGFSVRDVMSDVKTRVDAIDNFAEEAEDPILEELLIKNQVLSVAVSADTDETTLRQLSERVRDELLLIDGVSQVNLAAVRPYELSIEVSENTLREFGLTFDQVANSVRMSSLDLPGGSIRTEGGEILVRTEAKRYTAPEFEDITVVTRPDGSVVKLRDISHIVDGFEEVDLENRFDGRPAMLINVFRTGDEDTLEVASKVKNFVANTAPKFMPPGVTLEIWRDDSLFLDGRLRLLAKNGLMGLALVFIVLALFLRPTLALLVSIGIPVSFAGAIAMMPITGISINMISLFAFILVLGIVVDDAIVVGENVFRRMRNGEDPKVAAPRGTHEVGVVVTFGVLTTIVAFSPMLFLSGVSGKIWPNIPWIVIPTLLFSLVQSKLILPAHISYLRPSDPNRPVGRFMKFQHRFSHGLERFVDKFYRPLLRVALNHRYVVLMGFISLLIMVVSMVAFRWIKFEFFPVVEADIVIARLELPNGVPFETTQKATRQLEAAAFKMNEELRETEGGDVVAHILAAAGTQPFQEGFNQVGGTPEATHIAEVTLELIPAAQRKVRAKQLASRWRELTGPIPGAVALTYRDIAAGSGNAIDLEVTGNNIAELEAATAMIREGLANYDGVIDIADSNRRGKRELKLNITPSGEALGLRLQDVARQTRQAFYGEEAQRLQRGKDEVKVMVRYPRSERETIASLHNMKIRTSDGAEVPFLEIAEPELGRSYATIQRSDRRRSITITADVDKTTGANANEVVSSLTKEIFPKVKAAHPSVNFVFQGEQKDQRQSMQELFRGMALALLVMYILMAIPLKSYIQPAIVMSVIPFGIVGAVIGHMIMGWIPLSIMSMCGIVALAGVVVNDSLVLVDYVNRHRDDGHGVMDAVWNAGARRFRPIILTSLTTFAGLTPMLLETDMQARFLIPMAVSLSFGILFATNITLILIPCVYLMLDDIKRLGARVFLEPKHDRDNVTSASSR